MTTTERGRSTGTEVVIVIVAVSITETRLSANSATNSLRPLGDRASPAGSAPTVTVASTVGLLPSMPVIRTTVPSPRFAT
ncbi:MAG TPA: hypothetical protein VFT22_28710 [Kofleriaceae bacterium]|nr:hypothetical protein [Kofleriaceae bacterium]